MITREQVQQVARLARLSLNDAETDRMTTELVAILEYMNLLRELDTEAVEPTAQVMIASLPTRADSTQPGLSREVVLGQSPSTAQDGFAVPAFNED